jgi:hypothetical protein
MNNLDYAKRFVSTIVDNNKTGVIRSLVDNKILLEDYDKVKEILVSIYNRDRALFYKIMKNVQYDIYAKNYTTSEEFLLLLKPKNSETRRLSTEANAKEWYNEVLDTLAGGSTTTTTGTTTTEKPTGQSTTIIVSIVVIGAIVAIIWYFNKN